MQLKQQLVVKVKAYKIENNFGNFALSARENFGTELVDQLKILLKPPEFATRYNICLKMPKYAII